jgi:plastocyanin
MPKTCLITIDPKPGQAFAEFNPQTLTAAAGDLINWINNTSQPHTLVLQSNPSVTWVDEIPGKLEGEPAPASQRGVSFGAATASTGVTYLCANHPEEIGIIIIK